MTGLRELDEGSARLRGREPATALLADGACVELVARLDAHEGPVYDPRDDCLYVTSLPRPAPRGPEVSVARLRLGAAAWPLPGDAVETVCVMAAANGMALAPDGGLLVCEQGGLDAPACISHLDTATGDRRVLVDGWRGLPLNSPNDVVVKGDGTVWFTDPTYGHLQGFRPEPRLGAYVYRFDPATGALDVVVDDLCQPNGLAFAVGDGVLYVADSGAVLAPGDYDPRRPHRVVAYDVSGAGRLGPGRLFATIAPGYPDGVSVDRAGRVYVTAADGIQVYEPTGALVLGLPVPGAVNTTFGGRHGDVLFVTADDAVWAVIPSHAGANRGDA